MSGTNEKIAAKSLWSN